MFRLKKNQPPFEVVDGPAAGQKYTHEIAYADLPPGEAGRFEPIEPPAPVETGARDRKKKTADEVTTDA